MKAGRKFFFGIWAIFCVSITTIILNYPADIYWKLVGGIMLIFTSAQTITDIKNGGNK